MTKHAPRLSVIRNDRRYHHGDLRAALVEHALDLLRDEGLQALTLRAVARAAGVSQTAPYRHFGDRRALMAAVAATGFDQLRQAMHTAMTKDEGRLGFKAVAVAYVDFALLHPALYRVMFGPEVANTGDLPELAAAGHAALAFVAGGITQLQVAGLVRGGDVTLLAVTVWGTLHGVVSLLLDDQIQSAELDVEDIVDSAAQLIMFGLAGAVPTPSAPERGPALT